MAKLSAEGILQVWEECYGELDPRWKSKFLEHRAIEGLIHFPDSWIRIGFKYTSKLDEALRILRKSEVRFRQGGNKPEIESIDPDDLTVYMKHLHPNPEINTRKSFAAEWWREQE